jgi:hypothetical protein
VAAATNTIAAGAGPCGTANPRANMAEPATVKADAMPPVSNGHSSSMYPRKEIVSQAISCASRVAGAWEASTWSRRR